jgi:hypothetical protein
MSLATAAKSLLAIWVAALLVTGCGHSPSRMASDCERRVEARVDPVAVQAWATNLLDQYSITKTNYGGPFPLYPPLRNIWDQAPPSVAILGGDTQGEEFVCVIWGSAAGHWGLSIGKPGFAPSIPQRGGRVWKPGIYFWRDFH